MSHPNIVHMSEEQTFVTSTTEVPPVGALAMIEDGRLYRFVENGATALVASTMVQSMLEIVADSTGQAVGTLAAGVTVLTGVGSTNNNYAIDLLKLGYVFSDTAADLNPAYRIKSNTLITAAATTGTITLFVPTTAAIAAASTISYMRSPWRDVIVTVATTPTAIVLGVAVIAIAVDAFGWICSRGPASVLTQGTVVIGDAVSPGTDAGSVRDVAAGTAEVEPFLGKVLKVEATTESSLIFLTID